MGCICWVFIDLVLLEIVDGVFVLCEVVLGVSFDEVICKMVGWLIVVDDVCEMCFS